MDVSSPRRSLSVFLKKVTGCHHEVKCTNPPTTQHDQGTEAWHCGRNSDMEEVVEPSHEPRTQLWWKKGCRVEDCASWDRLLKEGEYVGD